MIPTATRSHSFACWIDISRRAWFLHHNTDLADANADMADTHAFGKAARSRKTGRSRIHRTHRTRQAGRQAARRESYTTEQARTRLTSCPSSRWHFRIAPRSCTFPARAQGRSSGLSIVRRPTRPGPRDGRAVVAQRQHAEEAMWLRQVSKTPAAACRGTHGGRWQRTPPCRAAALGDGDCECFEIRMCA